MIKVSYEQITSHDFNTALNSLVNMPLPMRSAYNVKKICDKIGQARKKVSAEWEAFKGKDYAQNMCLKDDKGKPILDEMGGMTFSDEAKIQLDQALKDFLEEKVIEIDREKLAPLDFKSVQISAWSLNILDCLFEDIEAGGSGKTELSIVPSDCPA